MTRLILPAPKWDELVGGDEEMAWIADRHRKTTLAADMSKTLVKVRKSLRKSEALYRATEESVLVPFAAWWYVSMAGFSQKTLQNTRQGPKAFGMSLTPMGFISAVNRLGPAISGKGSLLASVTQNLKPFVNWINHEIDQAFPPSDRSDESALVRVALILGGKIIGQGQNQGGNEAVALVRDYFFSQLVDRGHKAETRAYMKDPWQPCPRSAGAGGKKWLRFDKKIEMDFTGGGNRPDMTLTMGGTVIAVAEIKGRKDTSNIWESWMPQLTDHMKTWTDQFPQASRLLIGTQITMEMIQGMSTSLLHRPRTLVSSASSVSSPCSLDATGGP